MKATIQRVKQTQLSVNGQLISQISKGLVVYLGVEKGDSKQSATYLAKKIVAMRIFEDSAGKMNLSVLESGGEILAVSQFTLLADTAKGNRPSFIRAENPIEANQLFEFFVKEMQNLGGTVQKGVFGADMQILQHNDGPVTIAMEDRR